MLNSGFPDSRHGGRFRSAASAGRHGARESSFGLMEEDTVLQAAGGLQDHVARVQKDPALQTNL